MARAGRRRHARGLRGRADGELDDLLDRAKAHVLVLGHTHVPMRRTTRDGRRVVNPGGVLRDHPTEEDPRALILDRGANTWSPPATPPSLGTFGMLDLPSRAFSVHRASDGEEVPLG